MKRSFQLGQSNEVLKSGHVYDLHNDYVPTAIVFDIPKNSLRLVFKKLAADEVGKSLALIFRDVDILELTGNLGASALSGLDEMGFKDVDDYDYDWLSTEHQSRDADHMVLRFDDGAMIRIHCAEADIVEDQILTSLEGDTL